MRRRGTTAAAVALGGAPPLARGTARRSGALLLDCASPTLAGLLPVSSTAGGRPRLGLEPADRERLRAVVLDLVGTGGRTASVEVQGVTGRVRLHLHAQPRAPRRLGPGGTGGARLVLLHAEPAPPRAAGDAGADDRAALVDRLSVALARRGSGQVAVAVAHVRTPRGSAGPGVGPQLVDRVRGAARASDSVGALTGDTVAVVAEDLEPGDELAVGRRLTTFLQRQVPDGGHHGVRTVATTVTDRSLDPEGLLAHLVEQATSPAGEHGLTVLPAWSSTLPPIAVGGVAPGVAAALDSGRFVLGSRPLGPLSADTPVASSPCTHVLEVCTEDDGRLTAVRVAAAGLAAALDGWLLDRVGRDVADGTVVLRLQPGGTLTPALADQVAGLTADRPGLQVVVQVPEPRLVEALAAERAALTRLAGAGVALGVGAWTGRLSPAELVERGIGVVELASDVTAAVASPSGAALVAALCAGLRAGLGTTSTVVADRPDSQELALALAECGVRTESPVDPAPPGAGLLLLATAGPAR